MKSIYKFFLCLVIMFGMAGVFTACSDDENLPNGGKPMIEYVRVTNPESSDSLLVSAGQGSKVAIVGQNLQEVRELWFNNRQATLIPTFITNTTVITQVPSWVPTEITNKLKMIFADGDSLLYDFAVAISAPVLNSMESEYLEPGDVAVIRGNYFYEPLSVTFSGGLTGEIVSIDDNIVEVIVPEGAERGPITITTNFGSTESDFWFLDDRNIILNYDNLTAAGSWRPGNIASKDGIDGNYLVLGGPSETLDANQRVEDPFTSQFWGHTRFPEERNLIEGDPRNYVLKFEARVPNWYGSYLQIAWGPYDNAGNGEVWGNLNGRGIWGPWEAKNSIYSTNDEWITVAIPIAEMKYSQGQDDAGNTTWTADMEFDPNISGTLSFWVIATPLADASPVEIHIDNVRIFEK